MKKVHSNKSIAPTAPHDYVCIRDRIIFPLLEGFPVRFLCFAVSASVYDLNLFRNKLNLYGKGSTFTKITEYNFLNTNTALPFASFCWQRFCSYIKEL